MKYLFLLLLPGVLGLNQCGTRSPNYTDLYPDYRIVGGHRAKPGSWPWMVKILLRDSTVLMCGASLIGPNWAVTAAHCFNLGMDADEYVLKVGKYDLSRDEPYTRTFDISQVIMHPLFNETSDHGPINDICLLRLNEKIDFASVQYNLNEVCLPNKDTINKISLDKCVATGWGLDEKDGSESKFLKEVNLPIVNNTKCKSKHDQFDENTQICAGGFSNGGSGTCYGDSGGPLQCQLEDTWYLMGVTSYGDPCAMPNNPDVFTKISFYHDWIMEHIK